MASCAMEVANEVIQMVPDATGDDRRSSPWLGDRYDLENGHVVAAHLCHQEGRSQGRRVMGHRHAVA